MDSNFASAISRALEQTRAGSPADATRTIQAALAVGRSSSAEPRYPAAAAVRLGTTRVEDAKILEDHPRAAGRPTGTQGWTPTGGSAPGVERRRLRDTIDLLRQGRPSPVQMPRRGGRPEVPEGARWEARTFATSHGTRDYRLYVPASLPEGAQGLVLMLHGCTQDPDDFACGTGMNTQADRHGLIVAYPHQSRAHNAQGCWNWFQPGDQRADGGEPAILASLARSLSAEFELAPGRVFVAGLSAGGAMAAILGATHPDVFAAVGVHSGLPRGAAHDVVSAFAAMRGTDRGAAPSGSGPVRTIVFHGDADPTVHVSNAEAIVAAAQAGAGEPAVRESGRSERGTRYTRESVARRDGTPLTELWRIEGGGHAWSGGSTTGSYVDPAGPDASAAMARFFVATR